MTPVIGWTVQCFGRAEEPSLSYVGYTRSGVWRAVMENTGLSREQLRKAGWRVRKCKVDWA